MRDALFEGHCIGETGYLMGIQLKEHRNRFDIVATLFHKFGHVQDGLVHGLLSTPALFSGHQSQPRCVL